ncbi:phosphate ABC transporter substrate-binding protein [Endozoicomonas montiporae]|uniref:Phosphate-binding protein n=2 Tax=Endozoicomonas montiporae TaxID=1027273 RepID=A0A081N8E6_9GAMM|nr:phosphate ABC transporter substrate-binding protein [Endozoicomonas montiporae]AMO55391.1 phosphate ABC transporter, periplasmic phosphate-binding protein [Endozoicomonas montiporae CL-33]KEQ14719.1 phosphate ABC transporter substrate-binding protein [Endozoicomonas montiporae]
MKKAILSTLGVVGVAATLVGCGGADTQSSHSVSVSGSTSVTELMEVLGETFQGSNPEVVVEVQGTGSSAGIRAANDGTSQIGMSSRAVAIDELADGVERFILAHDGIAVVVNNSNGVTNMTTDQISAIYKGKITNWNEVGGADNPIVVVTRDPASGTRGAFEDIMSLKMTTEDGKKVSAISASAQVAAGNGAVKTTVAQNDFAIGYISLGSVDNSLKALTVNGVEATDANISSGAYGVARPFELMFNSTEQSEASRAYLDWMLTDEAQQIVKDKGYISVI